jgi:hypothetical protein
MSVQDCKEKMKEYLKESGLSRKINANRIDEWANEITKKGEGVLTKAEFAQSMAKMVDEELARTQLKDKAAKAAMLRVATDSVTNATDNIAKWKEDYEGGKRGVLFKDNPLNIPFEASRTWIQGGSIRAGFETNLSPSVLRARAYDSYMGLFRAGIKDIVTETASGKMDKEFFRAVHAIDNDTGRGGLDPIGEKYAKAFIAVRDKIFAVKQSMNPYLEAAQNYLAKQWHDQAKTSETPKAEWVQKMMQRAGDKSFPDKSVPEKIETFGNIYDRIVKGEWGTSSSDESFAREYNKGGNIFRNQANSRQIIFNGWEDAYNHFVEYGPGTVYEGLNRVMLKAASDTATLTKFSALPQETFNRHVKMMLNSLEGEEKEQYQKQIPKLQKMFNAAALGAQDAPASEKYAVVAKAVMTQQYLAKISGIYHALQDPLLAASLVRDLNGRTMVGNAFEIANEYFKNMLPGGADRAKGIMENLGLYWRSAHSELMSMMGSPENRPGAVAKAIETMGSLNLYGRHINAMRAATATVLTKLLGDHADMVHADLSERMQQGMSRYGIGPNEWDIIRNTGVENLYGHRVLIPENVEHMSDTAAELYLRKSGQHEGENAPSKQKMDSARFKLSGLLGAMINDHAELSSASPTERTKYFLWGDNDINSPEGVLRRVFTQFKAASIETNNVYRRSFMSGEGLKGDYAGVFQHASMALFTAALAEYSKQLVEQGKTPEDPTDPKFLAKIVASSGFGGTFADSLLGAAQRGGAANISASIGESLLGPTVGSTIEAAGVGLQAMKQIGGAPKDKTLGARAISLMQSNTPITNTWAARGLSNFYLWNGLKEFMGPGYLNHLERTTRQTSGLLEDKQRYLWLNPTESPRP